MADLSSGTMSLVELAALLKVPERTLRRLVVEGKFPRPFRVGRAIRWSRAEVESHLAKAQQATEDATREEGVKG